MTNTTQHDPRARAQASLAEHFDKMQSVFSECVIKPQIEYQNGYITGYLALDGELTRMREQFVAQQARIMRLKEIIHFANHYQNIENCIVCNATPIPHTPSHWTTSKLHGTAMSNREKMQHIANGKKFGGEFSGAASIAELHNVPLYAAHIPTPSQQEALAMLYRIHPRHDCSTEIEGLEAFILARPDAPIPPVAKPANKFAEYVLDHYDRKSKEDRQLLGKHLAEWADRRYRNAAPTPTTRIEKHSPNLQQVPREDVPKMLFSTTPEPRPVTKYRAEFLELAQKCGAILTGKPNGSEAITLVFTVDAWRAFDLATVDEVTKLRSGNATMRAELDRLLAQTTPSPSQQEVLNYVDELSCYPYDRDERSDLLLDVANKLKAFILAHP